MKIKFHSIMLVLSIIALSACTQTGGSKPGVEVGDAWVRAGTAGGNTAAYMVIQNSGKATDRLVKASGQISAAVEIHQTEMKDGVMSMHPVEAVEIAAGSSVELKPGGTHIMLIGLNADLVPGDKVSLILGFENAGEVTVEVEVRSP